MRDKSDALHAYNSKYLFTENVFTNNIIDTLLDILHNVHLVY